MDDGLTAQQIEAQGLEVQAVALSLHRKGVSSDWIYRVLMNGDYTIGNDVIYMITTLVITEHTGVETIPITEGNLTEMVEVARELWSSGEGMTEIVDAMGRSPLVLRAISAATGVPITQPGGIPLPPYGLWGLWDAGGQVDA